jgi:3-mercaptopyruvate sulfurtransferase SseA
MHVNVGRILGGSLVLAVVIGGGCSSKKTSDRSLRMVTVNDALKESSTKKGLLGMSGRLNTVWVDARGRADFDGGHIPGAVHLPFSELDRQHKRLEDYDVVIVYDADYPNELARGMSKKLIELGHGDVLTLKGGLRAWKDAGNEIEAAPAG